MNVKAYGLSPFDVIGYNCECYIVLTIENREGSFGGDYTKLVLFKQFKPGKADGITDCIRVSQDTEFEYIGKVSTLDW